MDDATWLFLSLIPSGIGLALFIYGKKQGRVPQLVAGVALMGYPYVATTVTTLVTFGLLIAGALWLAIRFNW